MGSEMPQLPPSVLQIPPLPPPLMTPLARATGGRGGVVTRTDSGHRALLGALDVASPLGSRSVRVNTLPQPYPWLPMPSQRQPTRDAASAFVASTSEAAAAHDAKNTFAFDADEL